jgi:hypothetical protein
VTEDSARNEPGVLGTEEGAGETRSTPLLVIRGEATDEEVAALVAVVQGLAAAAGTAAPPAPRPSSWAAPARRLRAAHHPGPGAWRASGLPR